MKIMLPLIITFIVVILIWLTASFIKDDNNENFWQRQIRKNREYNALRQKAFGKKGEEYVALMLEEIKDSNLYIYNDFTFEYKKGLSTNIDHIILSTGGIIVIETKSNKGDIYGLDDESTWYAKKKHEYKEFRNPLIQNENHINILRKMLNNDSINIESMIIFPFANSLDNVESNLVYDFEYAYNDIKKLSKLKNYSEEYIRKIAKQLAEIKSKYGISDEEHINNIKQRYND